MHAVHRFRVVCVTDRTVFFAPLSHQRGGVRLSRHRFSLRVLRISQPERAGCVLKHKSAVSTYPYYIFGQEFTDNISRFSLVDYSLYATLICCLHMSLYDVFTSQ